MAGRTAVFILLASVLVILCCIIDQTTAQDDSLNDVVLQVEKRSLARDEEYFPEDEHLEDVRERWSLEPMELLLQFDSRKRRDAIKKRNIRAVNAPAALVDAPAALVNAPDSLVNKDAEHGDRFRRQVEGETKEERRARKKEERRLRKEFNAKRKAQRKARKELRRQARLRKKQERKVQQIDRQEFNNAIKAGDEAVLERMLNIDIDMEINMKQVCDHSTHHGHADVTCDPNALYRTMNGSCNNLEHTSWGSTLEPLVRWLKANYSSHGNFLPRNYHSSPRKESTSFAEADDGGKDKAQPGISILIMHWGQFTDHDITHTPAAHDPCDCGTLNSSCYPLQVPGNDEYFTDRECFEVPRTLSHCGDSDKREQFNEITAFIDASNVYGSTEAEMEFLRFHTSPDAEPSDVDLALSAGRLRVHEFPDQENRGSLLPHPEEISGNCFGEDETTGIICGDAGDFRANEQPGLTSLHTIFVRLHNVIADGLKSRNPAWVLDSDRVFDEARKIVGAIMQSIDYNEYLPTFLGDNEFETHIGQYEGYDSTLNPSISNVFASAGYRQGHSAVDNVLDRYLIDSETGEATPLDPLPITKAFFNARHLYDFEKGGVDGFMQGMIRQNARKIDRFISPALLNKLFVDPDDDEDATGLDLMSLNVLRGRDNGIQPYHQWREYCGQPKITGWADLEGLMTPETIVKLRQTYGWNDRFVDDIDPFIGFIAEEPANDDGTLGPTLSCIIGSQFKLLREGDRFFYLNQDGPQAFTEDQRNAIHDVTMARVLCETLDNPVTFQKNVFKLADPETNPHYDCFSYGDIPEIDLDPWCIDPNQCQAPDTGI
nr:myeloperoxidase [Paracentrotus lividus]